MTPETMQSMNKFCAENCGYHASTPSYLRPAVHIANDDVVIGVFDIFNTSNPALLEVEDKLKIAVIPIGSEFVAVKGPTTTRTWDKSLTTLEEFDLRAFNYKAYNHKQRPIAVALAAGWDARPSGWEGDVG